MSKLVMNEPIFTISPLLVNFSHSYFHPPPDSVFTQLLISSFIHNMFHYYYGLSFLFGTLFASTFFALAFIFVKRCNLCLYRDNTFL